MIAAGEEKTIELKTFIKECKLRDHPDSQLISILHKAQELYGYISEDVMNEISIDMNIPTAHIWGVATFYHYFCLKPRGKHLISVCLGTACYVKGIGEILDEIRKELRIDIGQTSEDGLFTLQEARCLGACGLAPVIMIDDKIYGSLTPKKAIDIIRSCGKQDRSGSCPR